MKDDRLYLIHISECIADVQEYTAGSREVTWLGFPAWERYEQYARAWLFSHAE